MNTPDTSNSGNVHGVPLAALLGSESAELSRIGDLAPTVSASRTVLMGVRNLDPKEGERIVTSGVPVFTIKDIDRDGIASVAARALQLASDGTGAVHISFDLDVCDPAIAPGVGTPVKGGLSYHEAHLLMETIADSGALRALNLVEVNPILDTRNVTIELGTELVLSALGLKILQQPVVKVPLHSTGEASRLPASLTGQILPAFFLFSTCQPGASPLSVQRGLSPRAAKNSRAIVAPY